MRLKIAVSVVRFRPWAPCSLAHHGVPVLARDNVTDIIIEGDFVVFLIGMRINRRWKLHKSLSVVRAMPKMLRELEAAPQFRGQFFRARSMISGLYSK
jgi:hypothetical protein